MGFCIVIPARFASSRLPGKPLLDIHGRPMIWHVVKRAEASQAERVVVATDDERIADVVRDFGVEVVMTSAAHPSGTDRLAEVARLLDLADEQILVNVQGDEPLIPPRLIDLVAENLAQHPAAGIATLCEPIHCLETLLNPNAVKVVFDDQGMAMYFSRAPIPWQREGFMTRLQSDQNGSKCLSIQTTELTKDAVYFRHIGMYAYRAAFLKQYVAWRPSMHEQAESLEQLRALSNGVKIHVQAIDEAPAPGVDTAQDLERVRHLLAQNGGLS